MKRRDFSDFGVNLLACAIFAVMSLIPYGLRVRVFGRIFSGLVAPLMGWRKRIRTNLNYVLPEMPPHEVRRLERAVANNAGRSLIEIYAGEQFKKRVEHMPVTGPGLKAMEDARAAGRPVVLVTGHFGNYDAPRAALIARGFNIGALYRPMRNRFFNAHYTKSITEIGAPVFPSTRRGQVEMVRFLRAGGVLGIMIDNHVASGVELEFFGKPAMTSTSAADLALKYDALLVAVWGIRSEDGLGFEIRTSPKIPHSDPVTMTAALTAQLEDVAREHPEQWFWIHRRWKPEIIEMLQRKRAAAKMEP